MKNRCTFSLLLPLLILTSTSLACGSPPVNLSVTPGSNSQCVVTKLANNASTQCGPYSYAENTEANGSNTFVGQDAWNPVSGMSQTLTVTNPGNWNVVANIPTDPTDAVKSFPNAEQKYNKAVLDNFHNLYSSFAVNYTRTSPLSVDTGFDLWFNNSANEVMIQHDLVNRGGQCGPVLATEQFGGTNGVPVNTWVLCQYGSEIIWQIQAPTSSTATFGFQSGSVDILNMIKWLENKGYLPTGSTISAFSYGFELCSTGGKNWTLSLSDWSITQN